MRRIRLRFLLFLLVLIFVFVSLLVFNIFFSFDLNRVTFAQRFRSISHSITSLPLCLNVNSSEFLRPGALHEFQTRCGMKNTSVLDTRRRKIRLVHFVHVALDVVPAEDDGEQQEETKEQFTYLQFAAVQSIKRVLEPDTMMMHYLEIPRGVWYTQCQRHLGLHQVLPPVSFDTWPLTLNRQKRRRIMQVLIMLRMLKKHGGVAFSDFNTFLLRRINVELEEEMVVASQMRSNRGTFRMGLHMMQSPPGHPFVEYLERKIVEMVENNDVKLHELELDQVVGQVVLEKYLEEHHRAESGANVTKPQSSTMDGVVIGTSNLFAFDGLHDLLTTKVEPSLAGKFRDVAGFHIDTYDFEKKTADTEDIRTIERMQEELTLASEWKSLDTLLGAVVRLVVTANTSAELEPVFT